MMNSDMEASDESNIQIAISRDYLSHFQNPPPPASLSHHKITPSDLYWYAFLGDWHAMKPIAEGFPNGLRIPLTGLGDTALHVAAGAGHSTFVEKLLMHMIPEEVLIRNSDEMLPVHLAALSAHHRIVQHLCAEPVLDKMDYRDIEKLFFMTIGNNMFDVAMKLFNKYPSELTIARDEQQLTALHMLARKPSQVLHMKSEEDNNTGGSTITGIELLEKIWGEVGKLKIEKILELTTQPSVVLFDAIESGNDDEVIWVFLEGAAILTTLKDPNGRNLLHLFFLYRRFDIFIQFQNNRTEHLLRAVDNEGNSVLHLAARLPLEFQSFSGLSANIQMQRELGWFKRVQRSVPSELRSVRNNKGKRPIDIFYDEHKQLSNDIKEAAKGIADSGMVVATLVATVAFAAALTVPGDKTNAWFVVFIFTNAVALFTSSASILSFLSNFTSARFAESEFVVSLHPSLTYGPVLLIISVAFMVVAFIAASFLIFDHTTKWVSYLVAPIGVFPLVLFLLFQSRYFDDFMWSRYYRPKLD